MANLQILSAATTRLLSGIKTVRNHPFWDTDKYNQLDGELRTKLVQWRSEGLPALKNSLEDFEKSGYKFQSGLLDVVVAASRVSDNQKPPASDSFVRVSSCPKEAAVQRWIPDREKLTWKCNHWKDTYQHHYAEEVKKDAARVAADVPHSLGPPQTTVPSALPYASQTFVSSVEHPSCTSFEETLNTQPALLLSIPGSTSSSSTGSQTGYFTAVERAAAKSATPRPTIGA